jgi:hypothetical protein
MLVEIGLLFLGAVEVVVLAPWCEGVGFVRRRRHYTRRAAALSNARGLGEHPRRVRAGRRVNSGSSLTPERSALAASCCAGRAASGGEYPGTSNPALDLARAGIGAGAPPASSPRARTTASAVLTPRTANHTTRMPH